MASLGGVLGSVARGADRVGRGAAGMAYRGTKAAAGLTAAAFMGDPDAVIKAAALGAGAAAVGKVKSSIGRGISGMFGGSGGGGGGGGGAGSPARAQAEQPLTEKTFNEFANKFLGYMQTLVGLSHQELRAAQNQELRTREMLAEGTGRGSVPTSLRKKKKSATDLLKLIGIAAILGGIGKAASGGIPDIAPSLIMRPRPKAKAKAAAAKAKAAAAKAKAKAAAAKAKAAAAKAKAAKAAAAAKAKAAKAAAAKAKAAIKANPKQGKAIVSKDGKVLREKTQTGKPNPRYNMAKNLTKTPTAPAAPVESNVEKKPAGPAKKPGAPEKVPEQQRRGIISGIAQRIIGRAVPIAGSALAVVDAIKDASEGDIVGVLTNVGIIAGTVATMFPLTAIAGVNILGASVIADFLNELDKAGIKIGDDEAGKILKEEFSLFKKNFNRVADNPKKFEEKLKDVKAVSDEQFRRLNPGVYDQLEGTTSAERKQIRDVDKQRYDELGRGKGTGVTFREFRRGQKVLRGQEKQRLEQRDFAEVEGDTTDADYEPRTDIGTPIRIDEPDEAYMGPNAAASGSTLQRSSANMAAVGDDLGMISAYDDEGGVDVAGSTVVNATGEDVDVAGNDNARANKLAESRNVETVRLKSLVARTMNSDPTIGKALAKSLTPTA